MSDSKENELLSILQEGQIITDEAVHNLSFEQKKMIVICALVSTHSSSLLYRTIRQYLDKIFTKDIIKEAMYQGIPYIGVSHIYDAQSVLIKVLSDKKEDWGLGIAKPLPANKKYERGLEIQKEIMPEFTKLLHESTAPDERVLKVQFLTTFCFGGVYSRGVIDIKDRELLTYSYLVCTTRDQDMLNRHIRACIKLGFDRQTLIEVLLIAAPFIGFPRCFTALKVLNEIAPHPSAKTKAKAQAQTQESTSVASAKESAAVHNQVQAQAEKVVIDPTHVTHNAKVNDLADALFGHDESTKSQESKDHLKANSVAEKIKLFEDVVAKNINSMDDIEIIKKILALRIRTLNANAKK